MAKELITEDAMVLGGMPVFAGSRVPVHALWEYLEKGNTIDVFLDDFPTVSREQTMMILQAAEQSLLHARTH